MKCRFEPGQSLLGAHRVCKSMVNNEFVKLRRNIYKKYKKQYKKDDENGELKKQRYLIDEENNGMYHWGHTEVDAHCTFWTCCMQT